MRKLKEKVAKQKHNTPTPFRYMYINFNIQLLGWINK